MKSRRWRYMIYRFRKPTTQGTRGPA
jgi:hypothetical protein